MREWLAVLLSGGLAGLGTSVIALWIRYERNQLVNNPRLGSVRYWVLSMLVNAFSGALASLYLWSQFTGSTWDSTKFSTGEFGAVLAVGVGGTTALQRYLYISDSLEAAADEGAASVGNVIQASLAHPQAVDQSATQAHTAGGGQQS